MRNVQFAGIKTFRRADIFILVNFGNFGLRGFLCHHSPHFLIIFIKCCAKFRQFDLCAAIKAYFSDYGQFPEKWSPCVPFVPTPMAPW